MRSNFLYTFLFFLVILEFFFLVGYASSIYHIYIYFFIVFMAFKSLNTLSVIDTYLDWVKQISLLWYSVLNLVNLNNNLLKKYLLFLYYFYIIFIFQSKLIYKYRVRNIFYIRNIVKSKYLGTHRANKADKLSNT